MSSSRAPRKVKSEVDYDEVKREDDDYQSALSAEEISDDPVQPRKKKDKGEDAGSSASNTTTVKAKRAAPVDYDTFQDDDAVSFHLVIKDAKGNELRQVRLKKHEFNSGSYGWNLADKAVVEDGQGSSMTVSLHANCEY
jgi:hypothetical protein